MCIRDSTNPLKKQQKDFPDAIPETPWGHYGKISGKSADHATGLVYSQEPCLLYTSRCV